MNISTATLGYPRIGKNREVKKALESFWRGAIALTLDRLYNQAIALSQTIIDTEFATILK